MVFVEKVFIMTSVVLPEDVLLFSLSGTILLPRTHTTITFSTPEELKIFEKALMTPDRLLGLVQPDLKKGHFKHGSLVKIIGFQESDSGKVFVNCQGVSRFELLKTFENEGLEYAKVAYKAYENDLKEAQKDPFVDRERLLSALKVYLQGQELSLNWEEMDEISDEFLLNSLAQTCPFDDIEKQALLETKTLAERCEIMTTLIEMASLNAKRGGISYH